MSSRLIVDAKRALTSLQRRYAGNRRKITRRRAFRLTCIEQLESRELMAIDFPAEIIAGRSLSAYSSSDVQGGQLKLSYAVYNQRELPMEDVQVSVTLANGVGFVQASLPTISSGQNLSWDLGSLPAYGRMSFEVTVSLADASVLSIDQGVRVQGRIDAGLAIDMAPAAMLRPGPIPRPELASTMDATALDPWIMEKAAELDYDPAKIFSFLNDQVGFEAYQGSLRGSRGTLWCAAGNSLDETSLGVALFRASGIPARYATGTLSTIDAERLIESMFPTQTNLAGYLAAGQQGADPASNPELIALARQHYWLQIDLGAGFLNADTSGLPGSAIGVSHTALAGSFNEVADTLRHTLTMTLDAEVYSEIQAAFNPGNALTTTRVLDRTWNAVELVGKPVTIGHFVVDTNQGGLAFSSRTIGYTPYFLVGDAADVSNANDPIFTGIPFQENLTNFPLGSQFLTGLALKMDISSPGGATERFHRQLVDRVGFANRKNGTTENIPVDANAPSIIGPFDAFTVNASAASIPSRVADQLANKIRMTQRRLNAVDPSVPVSAADQSLLTQQYRDFTRLMGYRYLHESDALFNRSAALGAVRSYYDQPRLILGEAVLVPGTATSEATVELAIDLRRDAPKVILFPGQSEQAEPAFRFLQGVAATNLERAIVASMIDGTAQSQIVNTQSVIEAAEAQNIPLVVLIPSNLQTLENRIHASEDALARISEALAHGKVVLVPESPVQIDQRNVTAWYETDAVTGDTISVSEDGRHVAAIEYKTILYNFAGFQLGAFYGFLEGILEGALDKLGFANSLNTVSGPSKAPTKIINALLKLAGVSGLSASQLGYKGGYYLGFYLAQKDPEAEGQLYQPLPTETTNTSRTLLINSVANNSPLELLPTTKSIVVNQNSTVSIPYTISSNTLGEYEISVTGPVGWSVSVDQGAVSITPQPGTQNGLGQVRLVARSVENPAMVARSVIDVTVQPTTPGLQFDVIPDPLFFVPFQGAELPSAFLAQIRNLGPLNELYTLQVSNQPSDWDVILSSETANVSAGSQSSIGVYLRPKNTVLPPAGSVVSFDMTAIATSDPSLRQTVTVRYVLPSISATTVSLNSNFIESFPGSVTNGMITVKNVGHRQENLRLESNSLPPGFTLAGLPQTISLAVGQSIDVPITMQISSNAAINDTAYAYLSLTDDIPNAPIRNSDVLSVRVVVPGAEAISSASINAYQLGQTDLGNRLSDLSISLSSLVQSPTDAVTKSQSVAAIDAVLQIISADPLLSSLYSADLAFARNQLASASTLFEVQSALDSLAFYLTLLSDTLGQLVEHQFTLQLVSNVVTALPGVPAQFQVVLQNMGSKTTNFDLSVGGRLPFGTNATFNRSSVTLQPGETLQAGPNGITLSLSFTEDFLFPASFTVNATALEAPSLVQRAAASVLVRDEFIQATSVTPSPSFTEPGGIVAVSAKLLSIVNSDQVVSVSYQVKSPTGAVVFSSPSQPVNLNIRSTITDVNLPSLDTTGLPRSDYTIVVSIADASGTEIPGAAGQASLQVGTPVSASIEVSPSELFSGSRSSIVTNTLRVDAKAVPTNPLTLLGQVQTIPTSTTLVIQGGLAYVAGTNGIQVVNIANPANPVIVGSFGQGEIVQGGFTVARALAGNKLLIATQASINATDFTLLTYSLTNPVAPSLLGRSTVPKQFISDFFVVGDRAIATTTGIEFFAGNVLDQFGDVLALDLADPSAVLLTDELFGGSFDIYNHNGGEVVNNTTMYVASTTSTGFNTQVGHGVVRVIDFSDRANLVETRDIRIPDTVQATEVAIDGNRALVLGSTGGWKSPFLGAGDAQFTGRMTLTLLDITDPIRPLVIGTTLITESFNRPVDTADGGARLSTIALGNGRFAISRGFVDNQPVLLLADITGDQIVVASVPVPSLVNEMAFANGKLYTTSQTGLMVYDVGGIDGTPTTIRVEVPISNEFDRLNRVIMDSFNIRPDQIIDSGSAMSLVWNRPFAFGTTNSTLTWNTELSGLKPNEPQRVTNGTNIEFSFSGTPGSFSLPATTVVGKNAIVVSPATQTAPPGAKATYDVTLSNPTDSFLTFNLSISGIPESWIDFERFVIVDPQSSRTESISITAPTLTPVGAVDFKILATANGSLQGMTQASLVLAGIPVQPDRDAHGVAVAIDPSSKQVGQGNDASYVVRLTNTGSVAETFALSIDVPIGLNAAFSQTSVTLLPGKENFREVQLRVSAPLGGFPGQYPFMVRAVSTTSGASGTAPSSVEMLASGVALQWNTFSGLLGETFGLQVTNQGSATETFDIQLGGPGAILAKLGMDHLTLQPLESQLVTVTTQSVDALLPGALNLTGLARSRTSPSVQAMDDTHLLIPSTQGVTTRFEVPNKTLGGPGRSVFNLVVSNTGNTEDSYTATIVGTQGGIVASLTGLDGIATQFIPVFRLPAYSSGTLSLNASLMSLGQGSVLVQVRSLSNGAIVSESLATLNAIDDPSSLAITAAGADGAEGDTGLKGLRFTVARSGNLSVETVVDFVVSGAGTYPINAQDFGGLLPAGTLTFSAGEASKSITIQVRGDTSPEFDESFAVTLSNPTGGGILVVPSAIGTIRNDDKLATNSDSFWLTQGQQASLDVLANDQAAGYPFGPTSLQFRDGPSHASIAVSPDRKIVWTPDATYFGPDSFSYRVIDGQGLFSDWTLVKVSINGRPIARNDEAYVSRGIQTIVDVLANDSDPDGLIGDATIELLSTIDPAVGQLDIFEKKLRFKPSSTFDSSVLVQYRLTDAKGAVSSPATVLLGVYNQNPRNPLDVNQDNFVNPLDVLETINSLNRDGSRPIAPGNNTAPFYDVNNDGFISPLDPLIIINFINSRSGGSAEGEYDKLAPSDAYFEELGKENRRRHGRRLG